MSIDIAGLAVETIEPRGAARPHPLLFLHGMWGGAWMWEPCMQVFAARGWRCHALNLRGHHGSRPVPDIGRVSIHETSPSAKKFLQRSFSFALRGRPARPSIVSRVMSILCVRYRSSRAASSRGFRA